MGKGSNEPLIRFNLKEVLSMTDVYTLIILGIYTILAIIFYPSINNASFLILLNLTIAIGMVSISAISYKFNPGRLFVLFRRIYIAPVIFLIYSQVQNYIQVVNPYDYDRILIQWDQWLFGVNPTEWINQFSHPMLTEYLQFSYMLFFFFPLTLGIELHMRKRDRYFKEFARMILFAFFLSYLLYFFMPAIGPRFTIHEFSSISLELPGLFLTETFRFLINAGGGIVPGEGNPAAMVNRDCMPSGHTMLTLINMSLAFKYRSRLRWVFLALGISLIIATVYLRYHYVIDLIAGAVFALIAFKTEPIIRKYFKSHGFQQA